MWLCKTRSFTDSFHTSTLWEGGGAEGRVSNVSRLIKSIHYGIQGASGLVRVGVSRIKVCAERAWKLCVPYLDLALCTSPIVCSPVSFTINQEISVNVSKSFESHFSKSLNLWRGLWKPSIYRWYSETQ